eukprot:m.8386 g.8386  ORF g.8386 m.8386 type:complete len:403 (+) comp2531_c0_seq1:341-1549(+)
MLGEALGSTRTFFLGLFVLVATLVLSQGGIAGRIWNVAQQHGGGPRTVVPIDTLQAHTRRDEANAQVDGIPKGANIAAQSIKLHHPPQQPLPTQPADTQAATLPGGIQKIVHQTWKSKTLYPNQAKWRNNCQKLNPDWEFRIYTDDENRNLIATHYPWFLETFDSYPKMINRIDAIRIFYIAHYGGVYMDLDYTCLRPFAPILSGSTVVLAEDEPSDRQGKMRNVMNRREGLLGIGNSFMAGARNNTLFARATHRLQEVRHKVRDETGNLAGVWFIRELVEEFKAPVDRLAEEHVKILPMSMISPMHWVKGRDHNQAALVCTEFKDLEKCRQRFPNATTLSFWTGTWQNSGPRDNPSTKLSVDRSKQVLLGLRKVGDTSSKSLHELEAAANYTGPSGEIKIF